MTQQTILAPDAPTPPAIVHPRVAASLVTDDQRFLLLQFSDGGIWGLPYRQLADMQDAMQLDPGEVFTRYRDRFHFIRRGHL